MRNAPEREAKESIFGRDRAREEEVSLVECLVCTINCTFILLQCSHLDFTKTMSSFIMSVLQMRKMSFIKPSRICPNSKLVWDQTGN